MHALTSHIQLTITVLLVSWPSMPLVARFPATIGSSLRTHSMFSCHVSLASFNLEHFHSLSLSFMTLTFVKNAVLPHFFCLQIKHSSLCVVCCFLLISCRFGILSCSDAQVSCPPQGVISASIPCPPSLRMLIWSPLARRSWVIHRIITEFFFFPCSK